MRISKQGNLVETKKAMKKFVRFTRFGIVAFSSVAMIATSFTTPALAEAKEKVDALDFTPLSSVLSEARSKIASSVSNDLSELAAGSPTEGQSAPVVYYSANSALSHDPETNTVTISGDCTTTEIYG